jgi:hypothetical protein
MTDTTAGEGVTLADQIRERASGYRRTFESAGLKLDCQTINGALEYGRAQGMEMAATYLDNLAAQPSAGAQGEGIVLRFGLGELVVNTGKFGGECAVFIAKAKEPGVVGQETGRAAFDRDCLQPGEHVFLFPSVERANEVADALVNATPAQPDTGDAAALRDWQPMRTAPKDGTEIETLCVHPTAHYSTDAFGEGWAAVVKAKWIDHNDGGWTWNGLCGVHMAWRPLAALSKPNAPGREG